MRESNWNRKNNCKIKGGIMVKPRVPETDEGITGEIVTEDYNSMMRYMRDKGWIETEARDIIKSGIQAGIALEIGPGPGYLGLEWLKHTDGTMLKGLEISEDMIKIARRNAAEYGLTERVEYHLGDARKMPFEDGYFDAVFSNGSLHEWAYPDEIFNEIARVLKPGGRFHISDMKRDMNLLIKAFMWSICKPKEMRAGLISSINAAYTLPELKDLLSGTKLRGWLIDQNFIGVAVTGRMEPVV
jgi:ubiquinone/menaquinone biosynthesis C-methylase UbiE